MWRKKCFKCHRFIKGNGFLVVSGTWNKDNIPSVVMNIYSPCLLSKKKRKCGKR